MLTAHQKEEITINARIDAYVQITSTFQIMFVYQVLDFINTSICIYEPALITDFCLVS